MAQWVWVAAAAGSADQSKFEDAFASVDAGGVVACRPGNDYVLSDTAILNPGAGATLEGVTFVTWGSTITAAASVTLPSGGSTQTGMFIGGSRSSDVTVSSGATLGSTSIVTATSTGWSAGDRIYVGSSDNHSPMREGTEHQEGEFNFVKSTSGTTVNLLLPLKATYTTTPICAKYTMVNDFTIQGFDGYLDSSDTDRPVLMHIRYMENLRFDGFKVDGQGVGKAGVYMDQCMSVDVRRFRSQHFRDVNVGSSPEGYGIYGIGCRDVAVYNPWHYQDRHGLDWGAFGDRPLTRNVKVYSGTANYCTASGFSGHGGALGVSYVECTTNYCGGGFITRAEDCSVIRPTVNGTNRDEVVDITGTGIGRYDSYEHGIRVGENDHKATPTDHFDGIGGINYRLEGARVDLTKKPASREIALVYIEDPVESAFVEVQVGKGATTAAIRSHGNSQIDLDIKVGSIDQSDSFDNWPAIVVAPNSSSSSSTPDNVKDGATINASDAGATFNRVTFLGGTVDGPTSAAFRAVGGDTTSHSTQLRVLDLNVPTIGGSVGAGEAMISIPAGYVDFIHALDAECPATTEASIYDSASATVTDEVSSGHHGA